MDNLGYGVQTALNDGKNRSHQVEGGDRNREYEVARKRIFKRLGAMFLMLLGFAAVRLLVVGDSTGERVLGAWLTLIGVYPVVRGAWSAGRWLLRHRRIMQNRCMNCGYDMKGLWKQRCPECGKSRDGGL